MNKRALIRVAAFGLVLSVWIASAFPPLVDVSKLSSAQAAGFPTAEPQQKTRRSFVFPEYQSTSKSRSSDADHWDRSKTRFGAAEASYIAPLGATRGQTESEANSARQKTPPASSSLPGLGSRIGRPARFVFPGTRNLSGETPNVKPSRGPNVKPSRESDGTSSSSQNDDWAVARDQRPYQPMLTPSLRSLPRVAEEPSSIPAAGPENSQPRRFVFPAPQLNSSDSSTYVTGYDRPISGAAAENGEEGTKAEGSFVEPATKRPFNGKSVPEAESMAQPKRMPQIDEANGATFPFALRGSSNSLISTELPGDTVLPISAEEETEPVVDQHRSDHEVPNPPTEVVSGTQTQGDVLPAIEGPDRERAALEVPDIPSYSEPSWTADFSTDGTDANSAPLTHRFAATPARPTELPTPKPPLPVWLQLRNEPGDRSTVTLPSPSAQKEVRRLPMTTPDTLTQHGQHVPRAQRPPASAPDWRTKPVRDQIVFPWEIDDTPKYDGRNVAQSRHNRTKGGVSKAAANQPSKLDLPEELPPRIDDEVSNDDAQGSDANGDDRQTLGEAPEETNDELQFIRRQSILLEPGEYQFEVTFQYLFDESDFTLAQIQGNQIVIAEARRRSRLLLVPIEFRLGLTPVTQLSVNIPFGWSNGEFLFSGQDSFENTGGIGDINVGLTRMLIKGTENFPDVLGVVGFSAPTGESNLLSSLAIPGSNLGEGFWTATAGLTFIQTYDPVVFFYGLGYRHRFKNTFDGNVEVDPGKQFFYRLGAGFAVNSRVTFSAAFNGTYITEDVINGTQIAGSIREPMVIRLAATIGRPKKGNGHKSVKTVEPFVAFGLTEDANNAVFGISWTR